MVARLRSAGLPGPPYQLSLELIKLLILTVWNFQLVPYFWNRRKACKFHDYHLKDFVTVSLVNYEK